MDEAEANGVISQRYTADTNTATISGLNPGTAYYFNVIVKDEVGNKAAYSIRSQTTGGKKITQNNNTNYKNGFFRNGAPVSSDTTPPAPGGSGAILMSGVSSSSLTLAWNLATDDLTPQASLQYEVLQSSSENMNSVAEAEANGTVLFGFTANISSVVVARAANEPQYYYTVVVRDDGGNKAVYSTAGSLGLRYTYNGNGTKAFQTTSLGTSTLSMNHLRVSPDQGSVPPAGIAIVKTAPGGRLVSEAGFALTAGTQSGRLYVETSAATDTADGITTGVAFSNPSAQDAEVSYTFHRCGG